jgi:hypothetical protein
MWSHIYDAHIAKDNNVSLMWHQHGIECGVSCGTLEHLGTHVPKEKHIFTCFRIFLTSHMETTFIVGNPWPVKKMHIPHGNKLYR